MPDLHDILALCGLLERGEIGNAAFFERFTREVAAQIGCSRAGVWKFVDTEGGRTLRCIAMFDSPSDKMVAVTDMVSAVDGPYFEVLLRDHCVVAPDARSDPATICFLDDYLLPLDIHSLLDVAFAVNGVLYGTFSCEQVGAPMAWSQRQLQLLRQIGSRASLTLLNAANVTVDTAPGALWDPSGPARLATRPMRRGSDTD
jgi:GAF domain-containing protein